MSTNTQGTVKYSSMRIHDYMYDPNFIVPTEKDHNKYAMKATMAAAEMGIAPVFSNMFSDLVHCPRQIITMRVGVKTGHFTGLARSPSGTLICKSQAVNVSGSDRAKFFKIPIITIPPQIIKVSSERTLKSDLKPKNKCVQTKYRESSAQTTHWKTPHYVIMDGSDPEILKLKFLNENLPPGMLEVEMIIRARRRRAWEILLPDVENEASLEKRRLILQAIELDQWAMREIEIQAIQDLRMELLERMVQEVLDNTANRGQSKLQRISNRLRQEHQTQMYKLKRSKDRELRRLLRQAQGISTKYRPMNIIDEHLDYKSEVYAPLMRNGEHPKRGHANIRLEHFEPSQHDVENMSTLPSWLYQDKFIDENDIKLPGRRLCIRETKWTEPVLKQLYEELLHLNTVTSSKVPLREKRVKPQLLADTMHLLPSVDEEAEEEVEAVLILQCIIRGRATQTLIYEGRDRCRELIEELQSTHFLDHSQYAEMRRRRMEVLGQQRKKQVLVEREANLENALTQLQSNMLGTMLDFLSKELVRVLDERKAHALALLYERERRDREAAEAGRRQAEERRRKEHDEMFKQVVKIHQETVDLYLQDIVLEGIDKASDEDAKQYIQKMAEQVEEKVAEPPKTIVEKEELIANMVCHFLIPEVEKKLLREKTKKRQQKYLRCAHEAIYNKMEKLPKLQIEEFVCPEPESEETKYTKERIVQYLQETVCDEFESEESAGLTTQSDVVSTYADFDYTTDTSQVDTTQADTIQADTIQADTIQGDTIQADTIQADTIQGDTIQADTIQADTIQGEISQTDIIQEDISQDFLTGGKFVISSLEELDH